jgi:hypothetical protein
MKVALIIQLKDANMPGSNDPDLELMYVSILLPPHFRPHHQVLVLRALSLSIYVGTEKRKEKVVVLRELQRAIIYNE